MLKKFLFIALLLSSFPAFAEERQSAFESEDFATQSLLWVQNSRESGKCHATRILPKWYLTAAHCVSPICNKECTLTLDLLQGNLQAFLWSSFLTSSYFPSKGKPIPAARIFPLYFQVSTFLIQFHYPAVSYFLSPDIFFILCYHLYI